MKAYTDLEQSKKLAGILPITSIDFAWNIFSNGSTRLLRMDDWEVYGNAKSNVEIIPCWSLAALLSVIPFANLECYKGFWHCVSYDGKDFIFSKVTDNPIDTSYEMILKLHELNLL